MEIISSTTNVKLKGYKPKQIMMFYNKYIKYAA